MVTTVPLGDNKIPYNVAVSPDGSRVYVVPVGTVDLSTPTSSVVAIDTATNTTVGNPVALNGFAFPDSAGTNTVGFSPDGSRAYVLSNATSSTGGTYPATIRVIDTATNGAIGDPIPVGNYAGNLLVSPDGRRIYVSNSDGVVVVDTASGTTVGSYPIQAQGLSVGGLAQTPDGKSVFATDVLAKSVRVINADANTLDPNPIPIGGFPTSSVITPDGRRLYVTNLAVGPNNTYVSQITVIDTETKTVVGEPIVLDGGNLILPRLVASPDGSHLYTQTASVKPDGTVAGSLLVIDTATNTVETIAIDGYPSTVTVSPDSKLVYVTVSQGDASNQLVTSNLIVIDTATNTVVGEPVVLDGPATGAAINRDGSRLYLGSAVPKDGSTNQYTGELTVIDTGRGTPPPPANPDPIGALFEGLGAQIGALVGGVGHLLGGLASTVPAQINAGLGTAIAALSAAIASFQTQLAEGVSAQLASVADQVGSLLGELLAGFNRSA